ncbi:unnamed protein product [Macrosiphum euphorbiae]|uniref:Uncharacterized protein n=1 Tax=Macrosiphum euphorbiae TaxID=13131 RepID=A0AAV0WL34_9HEMI|nr:unnamed protein product [Macrosiphum euphorbiae]
MNSFAVVKVVATMILFGLFTPTAVAVVTKCYECKEDQISTCGQSQATELTATTPVTCLEPAATTKCYEIVVKETGKDDAVGVLRGCTNDAACGVLTKHELFKDTECVPCDADDCNNSKFFQLSDKAPGSGTGNGTGNGTTTDNGQPSFVGSAVLCALLSSLAVAKMYFGAM